MLTIELLILVLYIAAVAGQENDKNTWWKTGNMYQIAPISFKDSNDDGKGDFEGIISKIEYLNNTGINVIILSPFYSSPWVDFGYDISNYLEIDPIYGSVQNLKDLIDHAKKYDIKVILDFVPNHTSNKHDWFFKSENRERGYENFYVWHDGLVIEDMIQPPNNWVKNQIRLSYQIVKFIFNIEIRIWRFSLDMECKTSAILLSQVCITTARFKLSGKSCC